MTNDNWPDATEMAFDDASDALEQLLVVHHTKAVPAMIGALVNWAVRNAAVEQMVRSLGSAVRALPEIDAAWRNIEINEGPFVVASDTPLSASTS